MIEERRCEEDRAGVFGRLVGLDGANWTWFEEMKVDELGDWMREIGRGHAFRSRCGIGNECN